MFLTQEGMDVKAIYNWHKGWHWVFAVYNPKHNCMYTPQHPQNSVKFRKKKPKQKYKAHSPSTVQLALYIPGPIIVFP